MHFQNGMTSHAIVTSMPFLQSTSLSINPFLPFFVYIRDFFRPTRRFSKAFDGPIYQFFRYLIS